MGAGTKIEWADSTFNPWWGCTKVSEGCAHCYADIFAASKGRKLWGPGVERSRTSEKNWREPLKWNERVRAEGGRHLVFCASMADVFDPEVPDEWRDDLFGLIKQTHHLTWLLLTKRPVEMRDYMVQFGRDCGLPGNIWAGTTAENQPRADERLPILLDTPAAKHFVSIEPMLGPVDVTRIPFEDGTVNALTADHEMIDDLGYHHAVDGPTTRLDWVICGGESGSKARPMHPDWVRTLRDQCSAAGVPFMFKQWGEWAPSDGDEAGYWVANDGSLGKWDEEDPKASRVANIIRVGKAKAGRMLDGVEHLARP